MNARPKVFLVVHTAAKLALEMVRVPGYYGFTRTNESLGEALAASCYPHSIVSIKVKDLLGDKRVHNEDPNYASVRLKLKIKRPKDYLQTPWHEVTVLLLPPNLAHYFGYDEDQVRGREDKRDDSGIL